MVFKRKICLPIMCVCVFLLMSRIEAWDKVKNEISESGVVGNWSFFFFPSSTAVTPVWNNVCLYDCVLNYIGEKRKKKSAS